MCIFFMKNTNPEFINMSDCLKHIVMKNLTTLSTLVLALTLISFSCSKDNNDEPEPTVVWDDYLPGKWVLTECKTNENLTPCGTLLYPFNTYSEYSRNIKIYAELEFYNENEKIIKISDCEGNIKTIGVNWSAIEPNLDGLIYFYSNLIFCYDSYIRFHIDSENNTMSMDLIMEYSYWGGSLNPDEHVRLTHKCLFKKITAK